MREQWEAAQADLWVLLEEDDDYVRFLESIEQCLARKLRFKCQSQGESRVKSVAFDRFVESAAQLRHLHVLFQDKLKLIAEPSDDASSINVKCDSLVEILADMLCALRVLYGQLFCRSEATHAVLEKALAEKSKEWDGKVLEEYLETQHLTIEKLVSRPLKRFENLIEFVETLSVTLSKEGGVEAESNDSNEDSEERLDYAAQLVRIVQENKQHICSARANAQEEKKLIALQTSFSGNGADILSDLSNNKLLLDGEVFMSLFDATATNTGLFTSSEKAYVHVFQDGTLVCSKRQSTQLGVSFMIQYRLQLKQDAVFLELTPVSVPVLESSEEARALVLISQDTILVVILKDATECQLWAHTIGELLEMNGSRAETLQQNRTIDELPIRGEISAQLVGNDTASKEFASFHDDHLPGIFWIAPRQDPDLAQWELVEIVFYAKRLLVFKLRGWKRHSALCDFDTCAPEVEISEQMRGDKEWSLVISNGSTNSITLVSKKRTRIDFWFDQVWKDVGRVSKRTEKEEIEGQGMKEEETGFAQRKSRKPTGKKRKLTIASNLPDNHIASAKPEESSPSAVSSCHSKPVDDFDEECEKSNKSAMTIDEAENSSATPRVKKRGRVFGKLKQASAAASTEEKDILAAITLAGVKAPKRKCLKRKSADLDDSAPALTQPSPSFPAVESTNETGTTQPLVIDKSTEHKSLKPQKVRIILTGIELTASIRKCIDSIAGAVYEDDIEKATHVLAPKDKLKRTVKLLCGVSRCAHVLDVRWLDESARVGAPVSERAHCLKDVKAEAKWQFDLEKTMYDFTPEQRQKLFAGHQMFITNHKTVLPPVKDLAKIVECAGGTAMTKGSADPNHLVITSEAALATASVRKMLVRANPQRVYSAELILSSILQQHVDFDKNRLELKSRRRK